MKEEQEKVGEGMSHSFPPPFFNLVIDKNTISL